MTTAAAAANYGIWLYPESPSDPTHSKPAQKLQITIANQQNNKGLLGLPLELRTSIFSHAIEHHQENTVFPVDARDARHLAGDLSCRACHYYNPGSSIWLTSRRQLLARLPEAITPDLMKYVPPKAKIPFWACRHRLIPNVKALRLASRQLNTEIIDFLTNFSTKSSMTFLFVDVCGPPEQLHSNFRDVNKCGLPRRLRNHNSIR